MIAKMATKSKTSAADGNSKKCIGSNILQDISVPVN